MRTCNWAYFSQQLKLNLIVRYSTPEALNFPLFAPTDYINENAYVLGS